MPDFTTRARAKWVLTGEHTVLRGGTAITLPHPDRSLILRYTRGDQRLEVMPPPAGPVVLDILNSIQDEREQEGFAFSIPRGRLEIESSIPIGAGLGSSAALCVAIGRWLAEPLRLSDIAEFATGLEHRFHGRSSGMDVAAICADEPISFHQGKATSLGIKRLPRFTFHDTDQRARTSDCVIKVEALRERDPRRALEIDEAMSSASRLALEGLVRFDQDQSPVGLELLARAMKQAQGCFAAWGLITPKAQEIHDELLARGALAAKMTGAGGGGMLVALWPL